ncbi:MAG: hypothetical protein ACREOZ_02270 [Gloeomargaritales cyanobacterium]
MKNLETITLTSSQLWNPEEIPIPQGMGNMSNARTKSNFEDRVKLLETRLGTSNEGIIRKTLEHTSWMGKLDPRLPLHRHFKPRLPHMGLHRLTENMAMDTVYPKKGIIMKDYLGNTCAQLFVGTESNYLFVALLRRESEAPESLKDYIRYVGCPRHMYSDRSKMQLSRKVQQICRDAFIPQGTTEANSPWQNPCERQVQEVKKVASYFLDLNNAPNKAWGHAMLHAVWCLNRTSRCSLGYITPHEYLFGETPDLSALQFDFWQKIYYLCPSQFPEPREAIGHFLNIAENVADTMTYNLLTSNDTIVARSCVR